MNEAHRNAWLAEMWPVCRELSHGERAAKRQADWEERVLLDHRPQLSTDPPTDVHESEAA